MTTEEKILELVREENPENPMEYVCHAVRDYSRQKLDEYIRDCRDCRVYKDSAAKSVSYGNSNAAIMIVNEGIYQSQLKDNPTVVYPVKGSEEGEVLNLALFELLHVNKNQIFWMNAVNCQTFSEQDGQRFLRAPNNHEAECCRTFIDSAIDIIKPLLIILLGNIPYNLFHRGESVMKAHGTWFDIHGIPAMPVYSLSFLKKLKDDKSEMSDLYEAEFCEDLKKAFQLMQDKYGYGNGGILDCPLD